MTDTPPKLSPQAQVIKLLEDKLAEVKEGKITGVVLGWTTTDGGAAVMSTGIHAIMLNHLSLLLQRRVDQVYDRIERAAQQERHPGPGPVSTAGQPKTLASLPRSVRRQVKKAQQKAAAKAPRSQANGGIPAALKP